MGRRVVSGVDWNCQRSAVTVPGRFWHGGSVTGENEMKSAARRSPQLRPAREQASGAVYVKLCRPSLVLPKPSGRTDEADDLHIWKMTSKLLPRGLTGPDGPNDSKSPIHAPDAMDDKYETKQRKIKPRRQVVWAYPSLRRNFVQLFT
jgi:hypothetical protein